MSSGVNVELIDLGFTQLLAAGGAKMTTVDFQISWNRKTLALGAVSLDNRIPLKN